jgi:hypothetical protein
MATTVTNNPYDVTQQKFTGFGDVSGLITGGARNGQNWDFMDQQGKVLTSVPYDDFVNNYQTNVGVVRDGITSVNGVPVFNFNSAAPVTQSAALDAPAATSTGAATAAAPAASNSGGGIIGGTINNSGAKLDSTAAPAAYNPAAGMQLQSYTAQQRDVNRATDTAAGQVESLLANDSPLLQRARTLARQNMAQRGLVNSSMAQGAGVAAMIDRITPIAQQDAQIYSQRAIDNMEAVNSANQFNVQQNNALVSQGLGIAANKDLAVAQQSFQAAQSELDRALQVSMQDKSIKAQTDLATAQQNFQAAQATLDRQQQATLAQQQIASNERLTLAQIDATAKNLNTSNAAQMEQLKVQIENNKTESGKNYAATLAAQANAQINALLADGNLDATAKQSAIDNVIKSTNASLQWASTFYNTTLPAYTAPGGATSSITPASKYSQAQANETLANLKVTEPGASYNDVVKAGLNAGFTRAQIDEAYKANGISTTGTLGTPAPAASAPAAAATSAPAPTAPPPAPTQQAIKDYVSANMNNPAAISQAAIANGVSVEQLASAVGVSPSEARAYFQNAGVAIP